MKKYIIVAVMAVTVGIGGIAQAQVGTARPSKTQVYVGLMSFVRDNLFKSTTTPGFDVNVDLNNDGKVNALDLAMVKRAQYAGSGNAASQEISEKMLQSVRTHLFSEAGEAEYSYALDFNRDRKINALDLALAKSVFVVRNEATSTHERDEVIGKLFQLVRNHQNAASTSPRYNANLDFDSSGRINALDLALLRRAVNATTTDPKTMTVVGKIVLAFHGAQNTTIQEFDVNNDGKVNGLDIVLVRRVFPITLDSNGSNNGNNSGGNTNPGGNGNNGGNNGGNGGNGGTTPTELSYEQIRINLENLVKARFFQTLGSEKYDVDFDLNNDGKILADDFSMMRKLPDDLTDAEYNVVNEKVLHAVKSRFFTKTGDANFLPELDVVVDGKILANDFSLVKKAIARTPVTIGDRKTEFFAKLILAVREHQNAAIGDAKYDANFDLDDSGRINAIDLALVKRASLATTTDMLSQKTYTKLLHAAEARWNTVEGDAAFDQYLDLNGDKKINALDLAIIRAIFNDILTAPRAPLSVSVQSVSIMYGSASVSSNSASSRPEVSPTVAPSPSSSPAPTPSATPAPSSSPAPSPSASPSND